MWIAVGPKDRKPSIRSVGIRTFRFSGYALTEGLEEHVIRGIPLRVYSVAKTVVDLFRYRNKVGIDIAVEALKEALHEKRFAIPELDRLARLCRMSRVMAPYIESLIA